MWYSRFSHDVTKIQTKKLSVLLSFFFYEALQHLNTLIYWNFWFERVPPFAIEGDWIFRLLRDAVFSGRPGKLICWLKTLLIFNFEILLSKHSFSQNKCNFNICEFLNNEFTHVLENSKTDVSVGFRRLWCLTKPYKFGYNAFPNISHNETSHRPESWRGLLYIYLLSFPRFWTLCFEWYAFLFLIVW